MVQVALEGADKMTEAPEFSFLLFSNNFSLLVVTDRNCEKLLQAEETEKTVSFVD